MSSPIGLHRVLAPHGVLPQAAERLDASPALAEDEVLVRVERLNLDAASFRQLWQQCDEDGTAVREEVLRIVRTRGKMHNPVTGSGGMLIGTVAEVGPASTLGFTKGDRIATLVSLTLTPLHIADDLERWDGRSEQVPCDGHAVLFGQSSAARLPDDLPAELALAVFDVCGAPALVDRVIRQNGYKSVTVLGGAGKSGSLALAAARRAGARTVGVVPNERERDLLLKADLCDAVAVADARDPVALADAVKDAANDTVKNVALAQEAGQNDVTVVCVDVPGCEHGAILATAPGGTVVFFSMATSFPAAALGAEGLARDVTMLIGNGYVPGHAAFALDLLRTEQGVRQLFEARLAAD